VLFLVFFRYVFGTHWDWAEATSIKDEILSYKTGNTVVRLRLLAGEAPRSLLAGSRAARLRKSRSRRTLVSHPSQICPVIFNLHSTVSSAGLEGGGLRQFTVYRNLVLFCFVHGNKVRSAGFMVPPCFYTPRSVKHDNEFSAV